MNNQQMIKVTSSFIKGFVRQGKDLIIFFKNKSAQVFENVSDKKVEGFMQAPSKGQFFNFSIKIRHKSHPFIK